MGLSWELGESDLGESELGDGSLSGDTHSGGLGIESGLGGAIGLGGREGLLNYFNVNHLIQLNCEAQGKGRAKG